MVYKWVLKRQSHKGAGVGRAKRWPTTDPLCRLLYIYIYIYIYIGIMTSHIPHCNSVSSTNFEQTSYLGSIRNSTSQDFVFVRIFLVEVLQRIAETAIFHCKMNKYCGDLRRRRIRAQTAQTNIKSWLAKFLRPYAVHCLLCPFCLRRHLFREAPEASRQGLHPLAECSNVRLGRPLQLHWR